MTFQELTPTRTAIDLPVRGADPTPRLGGGAMAVVGLALIVFWGVCWAWSIRKDRLTHGQLTWIPTLPFLAGDFKVHIDHTVRVWAGGGDPYLKPDDVVCQYFPYPPMMPRLFTWVSVLRTRTAIAVWLTALGAIGLAAAWAAWKTRRALGLHPIPPTLLTVAVLYSTPMLFAMERGQGDLLAVAVALTAVPLLRSRSLTGDMAAGTLLAVAIWQKYYPAPILMALLALRRWRAMAVCLAACAAIGAHDWTWIRVAMDNGWRLHQLWIPPRGAPIHPTSHSISGCWRQLWENTRFEALTRVPGSVAMAAILLPMIGLVVARLARRPDDRLLLPAFLWLTAAGTFALPYSNDYNLVPLPLAALAVWDRRDPVLVPMLMTLLLLWWQPLWLPIDGKVILGFKLAGLLAVGLSLATRSDELDRAGAEDRRSEGAGSEILCPHLTVRNGPLMQDCPTRTGVLPALAVRLSFPDPRR